MPVDSYYNARSYVGGVSLIDREERVAHAGVYHKVFEVRAIHGAEVWEGKERVEGCEIVGVKLQFLSCVRQRPISVQTCPIGIAAAAAAKGGRVYYTQSTFSEEVDCCDVRIDNGGGYSGMGGGEKMEKAAK